MATVFEEDLVEEDFVEAVDFVDAVGFDELLLDAVERSSVVRGLVLTTTGSDLRSVGFGLLTIVVLEITGCGLDDLAGGSGMEFAGGWSFITISGSSSDFTS